MGLFKNKLVKHKDYLVWPNSNTLNNSCICLLFGSHVNSIPVLVWLGVGDVVDKDLSEHESCSLVAWITQTVYDGREESCNTGELQVKQPHTWSDTPEI